MPVVWWLRRLAEAGIPLIGSLSFLVYRLPLVGELLVRLAARLTAQAVYHAPFFGMRRRASAGGVLRELFKFLHFLGMTPEVGSEREGEFEIVAEACPYGFSAPAQKGICDACMDFDRTLIRKLGGELEVLEAIPRGGARCRAVIRMPREKSGKEVRS